MGKRPRLEILGWMVVDKTTGKPVKLSVDQPLFFVTDTRESAETDKASEETVIRVAIYERRRKKHPNRSI